MHSLRSLAGPREVATCLMMGQRGFQPHWRRWAAQGLVIGGFGLFPQMSGST